MFEAIRKRSLGSYPEVCVLHLQADIWDVDGTGMQLVPDVELARKLRKVLLEAKSQLAAM